MEVERALVVFAHPDDAEFTCGGTIARWVRDGLQVAYLCATDGSAGWNGPDKSRPEIAEIRNGELHEAAGILGVSGITFLDHSDGSLAPSLELRRDITRVVRRFRPDVLVSLDPSRLWSGRRYINHPDHRAVGDAVLAVVACDAPTRPQFPELLEEGLDPFKVPNLWLSTGLEGDETPIDIGETIDVKVKAIQAHRSQIENMGSPDVDAMVRAWAAEIGSPHGMAYAEAFRTFDLGEG